MCRCLCFPYSTLKMCNLRKQPFPKQLSLKQVAPHYDLKPQYHQGNFQSSGETTNRHQERLPALSFMPMDWGMPTRETRRLPQTDFRRKLRRERWDLHGVSHMNKHYLQTKVVLQISNVVFLTAMTIIQVSTTPSLSGGLTWITVLGDWAQSCRAGSPSALAPTLFSDKHWLLKCSGTGG